MTTFLNAYWMRRVSMLLVVTMGFLSFVPRVQAGFVPTEEFIEFDTRLHDMATAQKAIENKLVSERLKALGYSEQEIMQRLEQLSDDELHQLASRIDTLTTGGDALGLVIGVLLVILIVIVILKVTDKRIVIK